MKTLTNTYVVKGFNRNLLFSRLKKAGIDLLNVKIIDEKTAEITIYNKDSDKYFAICKNMWYNTLSKRGGFLAPLIYLRDHAAKTIGVILMVMLIVLSENLYFGTEYSGDAALYKTKIEQAEAKAGIKKFGFFSAEDLSRVSAILSAEQNLGFISVEKRGNKAMVSLKELKNSPAKFPVFYSDITADEPCEILKIVVYSGTLLKKAGEKVNAGEAIIGAYYEKENGERVPCAVVATYSAKFVFNYEYEFTAGFFEESVPDAIAAAKSELFKDQEYPIFNVDCAENGDKIEVEIEYEKTFPQKTGG